MRAVRGFTLLEVLIALAILAVGMLGALVATVVTSLLTRSTPLVFWVEVVLITLFAVFWVVQTTELWNRGLRRPTES